MFSGCHKCIQISNVGTVLHVWAFTNKNVMKHSSSIIHKNIWTQYTLLSYQINHILVLMFLNVERSQNVGVSKNNDTPKSFIKKIGCSIIFTIHFGGKIPLFLVQHPCGDLNQLNPNWPKPRSSAMPNWTWSSPCLLLPGGTGGSGTVSLPQNRNRNGFDATHVIHLREKKNTNWEIYGNLPKLLQNLNNWKVWKPFYLLKHEISYVLCAIDPSPNRFSHLSPSLRRHGGRCCHRGLRRGGGGWLHH